MGCGMRQSAGKSACNHPAIYRHEYTSDESGRGLRVVVVAIKGSFAIFTALHAMQTQSSDENSVCLSVRLSVKRVLCDQTVERSVQIYIPYERTFSLVF